jgi:glycosyltransferase involved in cell wall biosynthesis
LGALRCSFIVSAYDRPAHLDLLLRSLRLQTCPDFEVIITDNAVGDCVAQNFSAMMAIGDERFRYIEAKQADCYFSANLGAAHAMGDYLCFPSDDGYYAPRFLEQMLTAAGADLIYCDCVYDGHGCNYAPMDTAPVCGRIDKGGFLIKREKFTGFAGPAGVERAADGWLIDSLVSQGATKTKVPGYMWIHN